MSLSGGEVAEKKLVASDHLPQLNKRLGCSGRRSDARYRAEVIQRDCREWGVSSKYLV